MTSSYEDRIVEAMVRHSEALDQGDDNAAAEALVAALTAAKALRTRRGERQSITDADVGDVADLLGLGER